MPMDDGHRSERVHSRLTPCLLSTPTWMLPGENTPRLTRGDKDFKLRRKTVALVERERHFLLLSV